MLRHDGYIIFTLQNKDAWYNLSLKLFLIL